MRPSVDKIKLVYKLSLPREFAFCSIMDFPDVDTFDVKEFDEKFYDGGKIGSWRYSASFRCGSDSGVVFFAIGRMTPTGVQAKYCCVEFNPNKTAVPGFVIRFLRRYYAKINEISSLDLAYDLKDVKVDQVHFEAPGQTETMSYGSLSSQATKYLRPKANDGRIKVYDKFAESKEERFRNTTRVEISYHNVGFLLESNWYDPDIKRLDNMLKLLQGVRVPNYAWKRVANDDLKAIHIFTIDAFLDLGRADLAEDYIKHLGINQRSKYRTYINERCYTYLETDSLAFGFMLSDLIHAVLPC